MKAFENLCDSSVGEATDLTYAPMNITRRKMASIRCPIGIGDAAISPLGGPGCCGFAFMGLDVAPLN